MSVLELNKKEDAMSWNNIKELEYPVLDADGELVALFLMKKHRDDFVKANPKLTAGDYVDYDTEISVRGS